jgi:general secretion pathway protein G
MKLRKENQRGMTLVEILAVIVLLSLIMAVVIRQIAGKSEAAKARLNEAKISSVRSALQNYRLEYGVCPAKLEDLLSGGNETKGSGKVFIAMVKEDELKDIWVTPFIYEVQNNGRSYKLTSLGADGVPGGADVNQDVTVGP